MDIFEETKKINRLTSDCLLSRMDETDVPLEKMAFTLKGIGEALGTVAHGLSGTSDVILRQLPIFMFGVPAVIGYSKYLLDKKSTEEYREQKNRENKLKSEFIDILEKTEEEDQEE